MRRTDLGEFRGQACLLAILTTAVIPYVEPKEEKAADFSSTLTSTMPMAAVSHPFRQTRDR